jgi:hypothetical protein
MELIEQTPNLADQEQVTYKLFATASIIKGILRGQMEIAKKMQSNLHKIERMARFLGEMSDAELGLNPIDLKLTREQAKERIKRLKEQDPHLSTPEGIELSIHSSSLITSTAQFEMQFLPLGKSMDSDKEIAPAFRISVDESLPLNERKLQVVQLDPETLSPTTD